MQDVIQFCFVEVSLLEQLFDPRLVFRPTLAAMATMCSARKTFAGTPS
jgi:hypothetical protein